MARFLPAREIRNVIGAAAAASIPDEYGETLPCPVRAGDAVVLRAVFFATFRGPGGQVTEPPTFVIDVDGASGVVLRLARCTPDEVGCTPPLRPLPGAGIDTSQPVEDYVRRRERLLDLCPAVWEAFVAGVGAPEAASEGDVREFFELLLTITPADVSAFYPGVAGDFLQWLRTTTGAP